MKNLSKNIHVFSRRFSREKCPTLTVASFFSSDHRPHRVCTTFYRLHSRSHVLVSTRFTVNPAVTGSSPCFSQKLFRAIFFGTVRLSIFFGTGDFFSKFFLSPKGLPFKFFDILQQTEVSKNPKGTPFLVFRHYETVSKISFFVFFSKIFPKSFIYFLNVSKGSPLNFFDILQQTGFSKSRKGPPFNKLFSKCAFLSLRYSADFRRFRLVSGYIRILDGRK